MVSDLRGLGRQSKLVRLQQDRSRLACDLHDGLLQSLAGIALQLERLRCSLKVGNAAASEQLENVQMLILEEQRRLRELVSQLKGDYQPLSLVDADLTGCLMKLSQKIEQAWGLRVEVSSKIARLEMPVRHMADVYYLIHEALINSARHARATLAVAEIDVRPDRIHIIVRDNGRGFSFQGRYDLNELCLLGWGPRSLKDRIAVLSGQLVLESSHRGTCLEMTW